MSTGLAAGATFFALSGAVLSLTFTIAFGVFTSCSPDSLAPLKNEQLKLLFQQFSGFLEAAGLCRGFFENNRPPLLTSFAMSLMATVFGFCATGAMVVGITGNKQMLMAGAGLSFFSMVLACLGFVFYTDFKIGDDSLFGLGWGQGCNIGACVSFLFAAGLGGVAFATAGGQPGSSQKKAPSSAPGVTMNQNPIQGAPENV